jgi:hypothetical protein
MKKGDPHLLFYDENKKDEKQRTCSMYDRMRNGYNFQLLTSKERGRAANVRTNKGIISKLIMENFVKSCGLH